MIDLGKSPESTAYVAAMLYLYWQKGLCVRRADYSDEWKVDLNDLHRDAAEMIEKIEQWNRDEWRRATETPAHREAREARQRELSRQRIEDGPITG